MTPGRFFVRGSRPVAVYEREVDMEKVVDCLKGHNIVNGEIQMDQPLWFVSWGWEGDDEEGQNMEKMQTKKFNNFNDAEAFFLKKVEAGYAKGRLER